MSKEQDISQPPSAIERSPSGLSSPDHRTQLRERSRELSQNPSPIDVLRMSIPDKYVYIQDAGSGSYGHVFYCAPKEYIHKRSSVNVVRSKAVVIKVAKRAEDDDKGFIFRNALAREVETAGYFHGNLPEQRDHEDLSLADIFDYDRSCLDELQCDWGCFEAIPSGLTLWTLCKATQRHGIRVTEELSFHFMRQITGALDALHNLSQDGIVHRNVNPQNVMIRFPGRHPSRLPDAVLIDCGSVEFATPDLVKEDIKDTFGMLKFFNKAGWGCDVGHGTQEKPICSKGYLSGQEAYDKSSDMSGLDTSLHSPEWLDLQQWLSKDHIANADGELKAMRYRFLPWTKKWQQEAVDRGGPSPKSLELLRAAQQDANSLSDDSIRAVLAKFE
ncbi:hypothetical protein BDV96DRAFT_595989 [Lophiotrema nucula]|uniref:Protein kinase domain-containing protein n=1 Tax=Lophiotrema nucula TaxID=690887 RepID=A0A6A5ZLX0_9PLEO|nr:hypothetical protein BDV96DRAFT_595989 [Lophiotrema nucula]